MAYDKVVDSAALDGALTGIADAIRGKTGSAEKLTLDGMAAAIAGLQTGGGAQYGETLFDVFHGYCIDNGFTVIEFTVVADATANTTVPHTLGRVPDIVVLYPKTPLAKNSGYQFGVATTLDDLENNRTIKYLVDYEPKYGLVGVLTSLEKTLYRFLTARSASEVVIRGGTDTRAKLLAGTYILAVK